jgi:hypothetical protein
MWIINEDETKAHWLEIQDPEGWYSANVRFDGCVHLRRYFNRPLPDNKDDACYMQAAWRK